MALDVLVQVPGGQRIASGSHWRRPVGRRRHSAGKRAAHLHRGVARQFAAVLPVVEDHVLHVLAGEAGAWQAVATVQPLLDHGQAEAGAQASGCALVADDQVVSLQWLVRVGEPVAVVGVFDVVGAEEVGQVGRSKDSLLHCVGIAAPGAGRSRAVQDRDAGDLPGRRAWRRVALLHLSVGHVRHHRDVGIERLAAVI